MKKALIAVCAVLFVLFAYLGYLGFFTKLVVLEKEMGPFHLVYKEHTGDYSGTGAIQKEIYYSLLNNDKIETLRGFGIYYDDPGKVKRENLRSIAGCMLEQKDYLKIDDLKKRYKVKYFDRTRCVVSKFQFLNSLSITLGAFRVYPRLQKYIKSMGYKTSYAMEIYDAPGKKIYYLMPVTE